MDTQSFENELAAIFAKGMPNETPHEVDGEIHRRLDDMRALTERHPEVDHYAKLVGTLYMEWRGEPSAWDRMREAWPLRHFAIYQHNRVLLPLLQAVQDMINVGISEMDVYRADPFWLDARYTLTSSYSATIKQLAEEGDPLLLSRGEPELDHLLPDFEAELDPNHWAWGLIREFRRARGAKTQEELLQDRTAGEYRLFLFNTVLPSTLMRVPLRQTSHRAMPGPEYPGWVTHLFRSILCQVPLISPEKVRIPSQRVTA